MNYEVNEDTLAIIPYQNGTKIIERDNEYIIDCNPYKVMEYSCEYFGSSIDGRIKGTKNMLGSIYKAPIIIEESKNLIFFPTSSPNVYENNWISLKNVIGYKKEGNKTKIIFRNNKELLVDIPYLSIDNQVLRASRLESILSKRKNSEKNDLK